MEQNEQDTALMSQVLLVHHATLSVLEQKANPKMLLDTLKLIVEVAKGEQTLSEGQGELSLGGLRDAYQEKFGEGFEAWVAEQRRLERESAQAIANAFARLFWGES